jgi:hypothetical protein
VRKESPAQVLAVLFGSLLMSPGLGALETIAAFGLERDFRLLWTVGFARRFGGIPPLAFGVRAPRGPQG